MAKALLIVEGAKLEPRFFTQMSKVCQMNVEIVSLRANVYLLYRKLKEYGFDYDVRIALKELIPEKDENAHRILSEHYAYTYLIFDCDAHDVGLSKAGSSNQDITKIVELNYAHLGEMIGYFTDETDPERGRLFVNYPMMESYRDCDSLTEEGFLNRKIGFDELTKYKELVGRRKLANLRIETMERSDFEALAHLHQRKALRLLGKGEEDLTEDSVIQISQQGILEKQNELVAERNMAVLNTSLFLKFDYKYESSYESSPCNR